MKREFILLTFLCLLCPVVLYSQGTIRSKDLISKLDDINANVQDMSGADTEVVSKVRSLHLAINDMILRLAKADKAFPVAFGTALDQMVNESNHLNTISRKDQLIELDYISGDLALKFKSRGSHFESGISSSRVPVIIIWNKGKASASKYRVRYCGQGYKFDANKPSGNLGPVTSPVKDHLVAGSYRIWLTKARDYKIIQMWEGDIDPENIHPIEFDVP